MNEDAKGSDTAYVASAMCKWCHAWVTSILTDKDGNYSCVAHTNYSESLCCDGPCRKKALKDNSCSQHLRERQHRILAEAASEKLRLDLDKQDENPILSWHVDIKDNHVKMYAVRATGPIGPEVVLGSLTPPSEISEKEMEHSKIKIPDRLMGVPEIEAVPGEKDPLLGTIKEALEAYRLVNFFGNPAIEELVIRASTGTPVVGEPTLGDCAEAHALVRRLPEVLRLALNAVARARD